MVGLKLNLDKQDAPITAAPQSKPDKFLDRSNTRVTDSNPIQSMVIMFVGRCLAMSQFPFTKSYQMSKDY
jgi:hypothetical protein